MTAVFELFAYKQFTDSLICKNDMKQYVDIERSFCFWNMRWRMGLSADFEKPSSVDSVNSLPGVESKMTALTLSSQEAASYPIWSVKWIIINIRRGQHGLTPCRCQAGNPQNPLFPSIQGGLPPPYPSHWLYIDAGKDPLKSSYVGCHWGGDIAIGLDSST